MEYKVFHFCADNGRIFTCCRDCRRCANEVYDELTTKNQSLLKTNKECLDKIEELEKTIDYLREAYDILDEKNNSLIEENVALRNRTRCDELIRENSLLKKECDRLSCMNKNLVHQNNRLMKTSDPVIFQHAYGELSDKIEGLKEDIIRLDKCLSKRPCVKEERYGE